MGGILVKCSTAAGGVEEQDQKITAFSGSHRGGLAFLQTKKKGLAKQDLS